MLSAGIITKVLSALFIIPLTRLIGAEGIGLLQMASPIFVAVLVLCASGIPIAVSKLVSERLAVKDEAGVRQIVLVCLGTMIPIGLLLSYVLYIGADRIASFVIKDPRVFFPLRCLSPTIFFVTCSAVLRGYFQGHRIMTLTAVSNITEQIVKVAIGLGLAYILLPRGVHWSAAGAAAGGTVGSAAGFLVLTICFIMRNQRKSVSINRGNRRNIPAPSLCAESFSSTLRQIIVLAAPVTVTTLVWPLQEFLNAAIIPARLQYIGFSLSHSVELYGCLSGMALGLVTLPCVVTTAMAMNLVPGVASAYVKKRRHRVIHLAKNAVRGAFLVGTPASIGLLALPTEISLLLFGYPGAGPLLEIMAFSAVFLCLQQTTAGILNGVGKVGIPLLNSLIGAACTIVTVYTLTGIRGLDIRGAAFGIGLGFFVTGALNTIALWKVTGAGFDFFVTGWPPAVASGVMFPTVKAINGFLLIRTLNTTISTSCAIFAGAVVYGLTLIFLGGLSLKEISVIPVIGSPLAKVLKFSGLLP
ncbi:MAG: polysaccharide biosynthesis protein [Firmicutes bacterium]|nr:polysaccharide biosynthesis protein [Bacillota bacterium]